MHFVDGNISKLDIEANYMSLIFTGQALIVTKVHKRSPRGKG